MIEEPADINGRIESPSQPAGQRPAGRGRLRIFFGYVAGVGKTFAMLKEARRLQAAGQDVVVGYVEPHGRRETEALLEGLPCLPPLELVYRGLKLGEFDLDAALARRPGVIVVDELAHSNHAGARRTRRWQDVEELLEAGIDVLTTCNVQHVESLNDIVARICGVVVRETVPDHVFDGADELVLVDLPVDDLLQRLEQGLVYLPHQAGIARQNFFSRGNLLALRELALRQTADRVHSEVAKARQSRRSPGVWETSQCLLVALGSSPGSAGVIRAARRLASSLQAELVAVHVEGGGAGQMSATDRARLAAHLGLAGQLGAETVTLSGDDPVAAILDYARRRNVTKVVLGKSWRRSTWPWSRPGLDERLLRSGSGFDVLVVDSPATDHEVSPPGRRPAGLGKPRFGEWIFAAAVLGLSTAVAWLMHAAGWSEPNIVMTYLLGVLAVSARCGLYPSLVASGLAVLLFNFFFTEPYYTVVVNDAQYIVTFGVMLAVAVTTVFATERIRRQTAAARATGQRTEALYRLGRKLAGITGQQFLAREAARVIGELLDVEAVILLPQDSQLVPLADARKPFASSEPELGVAQWVLEHGQPAGAGTDTLPAAQATWLPLASPDGTIGVLGLKTTESWRLRIPETRSLIEACTTLTALAIGRDRLALEAWDERIRAETGELRGKLLASLSHDLRTPLAVIAGGVARICEDPATARLPPHLRELLGHVDGESTRLARLVENLLRLTQLTADKLAATGEWHPVEETVGSALRRAGRMLGNRPVQVNLPEGLLMGWYDGVLLEQLLVNLFENVAVHTPPDTAVAVAARREGRWLKLEVADSGPGIPLAEQTSVFETFVRGQTSTAGQTRGSGLGLAICHGIATVHGGRISATSPSGGGTLIRVELPQPELPEAFVQPVSPEGKPNEGR